MINLYSNSKYIIVLIFIAIFIYFCQHRPVLSSQLPDPVTKAQEEIKQKLIEAEKARTITVKIVDIIKLIFSKPLPCISPEGGTKSLVIWCLPQQKIINSRPTFQWKIICDKKPCGIGLKYNLFLYQNDKVIWRTEVKGSKVTYPYKLPNEKNYYWKIRLAGDPIPRDLLVARFTIPSKQIIDKIRKEVKLIEQELKIVLSKSQLAVMIARYYLIHDCYNDALLTLEEARKIDSNYPLITSTIREINKCLEY